MIKYIPFILFTVMTNAAAQLMLKHGMSVYGPVSLSEGNPLLKVLQIVFSPWVFAGLATFVISTLSHLYVLSKVALFAFFVFHEDLNGYRIAGLAFICCGTVLIAQSGRGHEAVAAGSRSHDPGTTASISSSPSNQTREFVQ